VHVRKSDEMETLVGFLKECHVHVSVILSVHVRKSDEVMVRRGDSKP